MKNVVIFGDSYSTFVDNVPEGHTTYYPRLDVLKKEDTWWHIFLEKTGYKLVYNDSWSGSTIGYTGYNNYDCSKTSSFITRYKKLKMKDFFKEKQADLIIVLGGTNDSWADAPLGELKYSCFKEEDLYNVLPAISFFLSNLKNDFKDAEILTIINTDLKEEVADAFIKRADYYNLKYVKLCDVEKNNGHPTKKGMKEIADQVIKTLR